LVDGIFSCPNEIHPPLLSAMLLMLLKNGTRQGGNDEICVNWGSWVDGDGDGTTTTSMSSLPPSSPRD